MRIDLVTIFPELFRPHLETSLLGKAVQEGKIEVRVHDLRDRGLGKHRSVDDEPYGGGAGMVMRPEPIFEMVEPLVGESTTVILLTPRGERLHQRRVEQLASVKHLVVICGRFEGVDERVAEHLADLEISLGDFVLAGGEVAAMALVEAVTRLVPGVLGNPSSLTTESHTGALLEYPQYTRPAEFRGHRVPEVLLSGDHAAIDRWRKERAEEETRARRPDLFPEH